MCIVFCLELAEKILGNAVFVNENAMFIAPTA